MKISKKCRVTASSTIDSIEFGRTVDVPEAVIQSIVADIQNHLDTAYPESHFVCFVDLLTDYRGYKLLRIDTYPADNYELVLRYKIYLHDTTVAHCTERDTVSEGDLDIRKDYADTVCDIVTKYINALRGSVTTSQSSTPVTSSEDVEDFDDIVDDPNCREQAIRLIKYAAEAHNYIGDIDAEIEELGSSPESLYHIYHDIIDVGTEVQSDGLGNWRFLLPSETEYDEPVIHTDKGYYVVCARGTIQLVSIDEDELFY